MLKHRRAATKEIKSRLFEIEAVTDEAISKKVDFTGYWPIAREPNTIVTMGGKASQNTPAAHVCSLGKDSQLRQ